MSTPAQQTGERIRAAMLNAQVTQTQLGAQLKISQTGISKRLNGETPVDINEIVAIARYLNIDPADLLSGTQRGGKPAAA